MRVKIESIGGIAGRAVTVGSYDTGDLAPDEARRVREAVDAVASGRARDGADEIGADLPAYRVTVDGDRVYEVRGDPAAAPLSDLLR
ncbi:protealysin inhibitor emfourin [Spirillospora sp. CA-294931]|uniref:protealysin inhibitor emfourin n=1 Tax=Spirillospora sp. CA-294931 TaxID=3240042 RepID=UPI003D92FAB7